MVKLDMNQIQQAITHTKYHGQLTRPWSFLTICGRDDSWMIQVWENGDIHGRLNFGDKDEYDKAMEHTLKLTRDFAVRD